MKRAVLIVTPSAELGELISTSLRDTRQFEGFHFTDPDDAVAFLAAQRDCEAAIVETQIGEARTIELGHALRRIQRGLRLILIARTRPGPGLDEIQPWRLLRQPFLLPELFAVLGLTAPTVIDMGSTRGPAPAKPTWLDDAALASRTLERLTRATNIQEALILREFDLWASSGHLSRASIGEIKDMILNTMGYGDQFDLLRFMRLKGANAEHGVWAKLLLVNVILATIYDLETPISEMRTQTNALADALSRPLLARPRAHQELLLPDTSGLSIARRRADRPSTMLDVDDSSQVVRPDAGDSEVETPRFAPPAQRADEDLRPSTRDIDEEDVERTSPRKLDDRSPAERTSRPLRRRHEREPEENPEFLLGPEEAVSADAGTLDGYGILYSCLLTPRFTSRPLSGHLAALLQQTLPKICISYGWRLEAVEVTYDCLQWLVRVPPTEAIAEHIATVRSKTSQYVFEEFPELLRENLSRDFWAPGFSVRAGAQPHSAAQVRAYVLKTRRGSGQGPLESQTDFPSEEPPDDWSR